MRPFWSRRWFKVTVALVAVLTLTGAAIFASGCTAMGQRPTGMWRKRVEASPQWNGEVFKNQLPQEMPGILRAFVVWRTQGSDHVVPEETPPFVPRKASDFKDLPEDGLRITWLGHSTMLVEIDGQRVLIDPVWGERASPFTWVGPARFHPPPLALDDLPPLDLVVISHDHYDHLDYPTILELAKRDVQFVVPVGVGAHLSYWGVPTDRIVELDWWQVYVPKEKAGGIPEGFQVAATPARHFSGRSLFDRDQTLWAGWALIGPKHRVFYSGDTALFPGFREIGEKLGPFDATLIEAGAYNQAWADVHLGPEQAVRAHQLVRGKVMIPVHWGTFNLSIHGWTEPMERVLVAAQAAGVTVVTPRPGESVSPKAPAPPARWWPQVPWKTAAEMPVRSSHLDPKEI